MKKSRKEKRIKVLIAGLGNILLRDDGVGVHAVRQLQHHCPPGVVTAEIGTAILSAFHLLEEAQRVIVIDAMQAGGAPGTVYTTTAHELEENKSPTSLHHLGLANAYRLMLNVSTPPIDVVGIEPEAIDCGMNLSSRVEASLPKVVALVNSMLTKEQRAHSAAKRAATKQGCISVSQ